MEAGHADKYAVDPAESGAPPTRALIQRALRVAEHELALATYRPGVELAGHKREYWQAAVVALRWVLGRDSTAPISERPGRIDLEQDRGRVAAEAEYTHSVMSGYCRPPAHVESMGYLQGVENTLFWVAHGTGFAGDLSNGAERELAEQAVQAKRSFDRESGRRVTAMEFLDVIDAFKAQHGRSPTNAELEGRIGR